MSSWKRNLYGIAFVLSAVLLAGCERSVADALDTDADTVESIRASLVVKGEVGAATAVVAEPNL